MSQILSQHIKNAVFKPRMALFMTGSTPVIRMDEKSGTFQGKKLETIVKSTVSSFFFTFNYKTVIYDINNFYELFCHGICHDKIKK